MKKAIYYFESIVFLIIMLMWGFDKVSNDAWAIAFLIHVIFCYFTTKED